MAHEGWCAPTCVHSQSIWVDPELDVSLKQQFFQPSGDIQTATYTNIRYNQLGKGDLAAYAIKTDKKTSVDNH